MKYTIHTDIDTLSEAWGLLDEIGLSGLLLGQKLNPDPQKLMADLLLKKLLKRFISIVTHISEPELPALQLNEAVEVITAFFSSFTRDLSAFGGLLIAQANENPNQD